jgi:NitT/TauT family transport system permease protein
VSAVADELSRPTIDDETGEVWDEAALSKSIRRQRIILYAARAALAVTIVGIWELASRFFVDPFWISQPSAIVGVLWDWVNTGYIFGHLWATGQAMILGLILGSTVGVGVGFLLGRIKFLAQVLDPFISALYSLPRIALAPLFILWFGIGLMPKVMLTAVIVFFLTFKSTFTGVRSVDRELVDVVRVMGASRFEVLRKVVLPYSLAWIFMGLRLAVPYSLVGAVVAEFVASSNGIGWVIRSASGIFDTVTVFAGLVVLAMVGFLLNQILDYSEKATSRWRETELA